MSEIREGAKRDHILIDAASVDFVRAGIKSTDIDYDTPGQEFVTKEELIRVLEKLLSDLHVATEIKSKIRDTVILPTEFNYELGPTPKATTEESIDPREDFMKELKEIE